MAFPKLNPVKPPTPDTGEARTPTPDITRGKGGLLQIAQTHVNAIAARLDGIRDAVESRHNEDIHTIRQSATYTGLNAGRLSFGVVPPGTTWHIDMITLGITRGNSTDNGTLQNVGFYLDYVDIETVVMGFVAAGGAGALASSGYTNPDPSASVQGAGSLPNVASNVLGVPAIIPSGRELIVGYAIGGATVTTPGRVTFALRRTIVREAPSTLDIS